VSKDLFFQNEPPSDNREMLQRYRNVFSTPEGRKVLGDILVTCHFGVPLMSEQERFEYNVGVTIARMSGFMGEIDRIAGMRED
jgi:hypothetical protein